VVEHLEEDRVHRLGLEGLVAGEELVHHGADREDVGALVDPLAPDLLGRHVVRRAHDRPRLGHLGGAEPGQAEVHDLHRARGQQVDVRGLEVAVDDALGVGVGEAVADLLDHRELVLEPREGPARDDVLEVRALEQLHHEIDEPLLFVELEDGDDVAVVELRGGPRFPVEPLAERLVGAERRRDRLDGDVPVQDGVVGLVDLAHRPLTDLVDDLVLSELGPLHWPRAPRTNGGYYHARAESPKEEG
jgi:hypothetical protein